MESKESLRKEEVVCLDMLDAAIKYCCSHDFQQSIESFEIKNAEYFDIISESKCPEDEEQTCEHYFVFQQFQDLIDKLLSKLARDHNTTAITIFESCRDAYEGRFLPLFQEEHEHKWFVDLLMSWGNYETFLLRMVKVSRTLKQRK
jgi:hypothetical protein